MMHPLASHVLVLLICLYAYMLHVSVLFYNYLLYSSIINTVLGEKIQVSAGASLCDITGLHCIHLSLCSSRLESNLICAPFWQLALSHYCLTFFFKIFLSFHIFHYQVEWKYPLTSFWIRCVFHFCLLLGVLSLVFGHVF